MAEKREMTAIEFLKARNRMCVSFGGFCAECELSQGRTGLYCDEYEEKYPERTVAIVQKWSKEHPQKTFLSDFLEKYPNAPMNEKGFPESVCIYDLGYEECKALLMSTGSDCKKCWNRPLEE